MMDYNTLTTLGFDRNPLSAIHQTADQTRINHAVRMAVSDKTLLVVSGRRGMGKTTAVGRAIQAITREGGNLAIIQPNRMEVEQLRAADLLVSTVLDLSDESPKREREARRRQALRIMGTSKKSVVMVIEEAHHLSYSTMKVLKRLREESYGGVVPLLSIILVGQRNPFLYSRGLDEVRLRSMSVELQGLTPAEASQIIQTTVGKVFEEDAIHAAAQTTPIWLDLQNILATAMTRAVTMARQIVTVEDVRIAAREVDPGFSVDLSNLGEAAKAVGLNGKIIAAQTGLPESTVYHALAGRAATPDTRQRMSNFLESEIKKSRVA